MPDYPTIDYVSDLTPAQLYNAPPLTFGASSSGHDGSVQVTGFEYKYSSVIYSFVGVEGAEYFFSSQSYYDPSLRVYDSYGNCVMINDEADDPASQLLTDGGNYSLDSESYVAPYSGIYYVATGWNQDFKFDGYGLTIEYDLPPPSTIAGTTDDDTLVGSSAPETISASDGDDLILGGGGGDKLYGGKGSDTVVYDGAYDDYTIRSIYDSKTSDYAYSEVVSDAMPGVIDRIDADVEYIRFTDKTISTTSGQPVTTANATAGNDHASFDIAYGYFDGSDGIDTLTIADQRSAYTLAADDGQWLLTEDASGLSADLLNVERLSFSDASIALDIDGATSAGGIYRLYQATFDRTPDLGGLGYWIDQADDGKSGVRMAEDFTWSQEFQTLYGVTTHDNYLTGANITSLVTGFYQHVLHRAPDQGGLDFYVGKITSHEKTVGQVLAEISDSPENYAATIGQIEEGILYQPWIA